MADIVVNSYSVGTLPSVGTAGRVARVTDNLGGLWMDTGAQWAPLEPTINASLYSGANAGDMIQAAINALPARGGTVDARAIIGAQSITSNLTVGSSAGGVHKTVTLLLGNAAYTLSGAGKITMGPGSQLIGSGNGGSCTSITVAWDTDGIVIDYSKGYTPGATTQISAGCRLADFLIRSQGSGDSSTWKALIRITDSPGNLVENVQMAHLHTNGYGLLIEGTHHASTHIGAWYNRIRNVGCIYNALPLPPISANRYGIALKGRPSAAGTVNVSGATVTHTGGDTFSANWTGSPIQINGIWYDIQSVTNATTLTLTASAGSQTGVAYTVPTASGVGITTIDPLANIEQMGVGLLLEYAGSNVVVGGNCMGNGTGIKLLSSTNNLFLGIRANQSATENIHVASSSGRNTFLCPTVYMPANFGTMNGDRDTILGSPEIQQQIGGTLSSPLLLGGGAVAKSGNAFVAEAVTAGNSVTFWHNGPGGGPVWETTGFARYQFRRGTREELAIDTAGADETALLLWDQSAGTLKRVYRGPANSGGTNYRVLRIDN
jgi:hypothetical protein